MPLFSRRTQLRLRRTFRRRQKQVENAAEQFDDNLIGRFDRLLRVRRFVAGWMLLVVLVTVGTILQTLGLSQYYQTVQPRAGGIYNEGMVGTYSNANPIFATGSVDTAVSRLIFAGLFKYNNQNNLTGDLASSYSVDTTGRHYEVKLKPGLTWQDGQPLTADDVVFTYHLIENPDVGSPLLGSWQGITVTAANKLTVDFDLPNAFAAFPYNLVTGILPKHLLAGIPAEQLRSAPFNTTKPVGAGPFAWQAIQSSTTLDAARAVTLIALQPFKAYNGGAPKLDGFVLHAFGSQDAMVQAFKHRNINAMAGLDELPSQFAHQADVHELSFPSTAAVMTFFKTSTGILSDTQVRQALVQGADTNRIVNQLGYPAQPVREPILLGQLGYNATYQQASYNPAAANTLLDKAGWVRGSDEVRTKDGQPLAFSLYAQDTAENRRTVQLLVKDWRAIGVRVTPVLQSLENFQTTLEFHSYDALLYGISIGADPDVFPYWDSSQADIRATQRLNFSEYKNTTADAALEAGRTRLDPALRVIKYAPFLKAWQQDAPALGLYQPRFLYITRGEVYGLPTHTLNVDSDRYESVAHWQIRTAKVTNR